MLEVAHAVCETTIEDLRECATIHNPIFDMDEYYIVLVLVKDSMDDKLTRRKFYGYPFMPKPRPDQSVWLYNKKSDKIVRLWVLPNAATMAYISERSWVAPRYETMKQWSDAFFAKKFWEFIRQQQKRNDLLSEDEALALNFDELIQRGEDDIDSIRAKPLDSIKAEAEEFIDAQKVVVSKDCINGSRQT
jgi:hypothetical protein